MTTHIENIDEFLKCVSAKDAAGALRQIEVYKEGMKSVTQGALYVSWITEPANLATLHRELSQHLGIPQRAMAIMRRPMSRVQKAVSFVQAIEGALKRVINA